MNSPLRIVAVKTALCLAVSCLAVGAVPACAQDQAGVAPHPAAHASDAAAARPRPGASAPQPHASAPKGQHGAMMKPAAGTENKAQEAGAISRQTTAQGEVKADQPSADGAPAAGSAAKGRQVKGPGVKHVVCQGPGNQQNYDQTGKQKWSVLYKNGAKGTYKEDNRDEWSVYMSDDTAQIQLDLFLKKCTVKLVAGGTRINDVTKATR